MDRLKWMAAGITLALLGLAAVAAAQAGGSASVSISVRVPPIATIDFPQGTSFVITVPPNASPQAATIQPVRIPFTVRGNALASVSARPVRFLEVVDAGVIGEAAGPDGGSELLGHDIIVQFPVNSANYAGLPGRGGFGAFPDKEGVERLPGNDGEGTAELTVDMAAAGQEAFGVIHVVAQQHWTADGTAASPGDYTGSVEVTVTADDQ